MNTIGFLGAGAMGARMAVNLMRAGHAVRVFNRTTEKAAYLRDEGAVIVATPKAAAEGADYVIAMVRDDRASREIWLHPTVGAAQGMHKDAIAIECSTLTPTWVKELAAYSQGRYRFLESPVLGTLPQAESRALISLVGGDEPTFRQAEAVLSVNAKTIHYIGETGSAAACKLAVNAQYSAQVAMLAEALLLLERYGLRALDMVALFNTLPTTSPALQVAGSLMAQRSFRPMFPIELVAKDLDYALQAARSAGVNAPVIEAVSRRYQEAVEHGHGGENIVAISKLVEEESIKSMNTLNDQLAAVTADFVKAAPQEILEVFTRAADALANQAPEGLQIGVKAPDFALPDPWGNEVRLYEELKKGPVILVFYRGAWCPYCNLTLAAYQHALGDIHASGAQLIAVSPQTPDASLTMQEKHDLQFHVLSDKGNVTADTYKLTFPLQKELIDAHRQLGINLSQFNGDEAWRLPVPATFVVSQERVVTYAYVNSDHTRRADPSEVLEHLKSK